jgi:hypothetical protein
VARDGRVTSPSKNVGGRYRVSRAGEAAIAALEPVAAAVLFGREPTTRAGLTRVGRANDLQLNTVELGLVRQPFLKVTLQPTTETSIEGPRQPRRAKAKVLDYEPREVGVLYEESIERGVYLLSQERAITDHSASRADRSEVAPTDPARPFRVDRANRSLIRGEAMSLTKFLGSAVRNVSDQGVGARAVAFSRLDLPAAERYEGLEPLVNTGTSGSGRLAPRHAHDNMKNDPLADLDTQVGSAFGATGT